MYTLHVLNETHNLNNVATYSQHWSILKHMGLIANHTVFIQNRNPLLSIVHSLKKQHIEKYHN